MRICTSNDESTGHCVIDEARGQVSYPMNEMLKKQLSDVKKLIREDLDYLYVVCGQVGSGKSVFAQIIGHYLSDGKLCVDDICFNAEQFRKRVLEAEPYTCIIFDEAFRGASSRASTSAVNRSIHALLQEIRQKNLFILVVLPSFWDLDSYIVRERSKGVFQIYYKTYRTESGEVKLQRGLFKFFPSQKLIPFMNDTRHRYQWPRQGAKDGAGNSMCTIRGRWSNEYAVDGKVVPLLKSRYRYLVGAEEYIEKKAASLGDYAIASKDESPVIEQKDIWLSRVVYFLLRNKILTPMMVYKLLGIGDRKRKELKELFITSGLFPNITWQELYHGRIPEDYDENSSLRLLKEISDMKSYTIAKMKLYHDEKEGGKAA